MTNIRQTCLIAIALLIVTVGCSGPATLPSASHPSASQPSASQPSGSGIRGVATAGPTCPVERNPPDPACAPRPVVGARLVIRDGSGAQIAEVTTAADGTFFVAVGAGSYTVEPQAAAGLMGTAPSQSVVVSEGATTEIRLGYDTGIR